MTSVSRTFGDSRLFAEDPDFLNRPLTEQLHLLGTSHGCSDPDAVAKAYGAGDDGIKKAIARYSECNFLYRHCILPEIETSNSELHQKINRPYQTERGELLNGSATPWGYSLPRVLIEAFGSDDEKRSERFTRATNVIAPLASVSQSIEELSARLSHSSLQTGGKIDSILGHLFAVELLDPNFCVEYLKTIKEMVKSLAPELFARLEELTPTEKQQLGIAIF